MSGSNRFISMKKILKDVSDEDQRMIVYGIKTFTSVILSAREGLKNES